MMAAGNCVHRYESEMTCAEASQRDLYIVSKVETIWFSSGVLSNKWCNGNSPITSCDSQQSVPVNIAILSCDLLKYLQQYALTPEGN